MAQKKKGAEPRPRISIIVPARDPGPELAECLEPFRRCPHPAFEVLIVDDASRRPVDASALGTGPFQVLRLDENLGPAGARNAGARAARGEILFFIDTDVVAEESCLGTVERFFEDADKAAWGLTGLQAAEMKFKNFSSRYKNLWLRYSFLVTPPDSALFYTSVAAIGREAFLNLGGFDRRYRTPSLEDTDLGNRIWEKGGRVRIDKSLEVRHNKRYTLFSLLKNDFLRSSEETRTWLRNFGKTDALFKGRTSVPGAFIAGVALAAVAAASGVIYIVFRPAAALIILFAALIGIWLSNIKMLLWMKNAAGFGFLARTLLFLPLNMLLAGFGILWGATSYLGGKKY